MDQPPIDLNGSLNRDSSDPRAQARFLTLVKQACFNFKNTPIKYKNNRFKQMEIMDVNHQNLLNLQQSLATNGVYDEFYKTHEGQ